MIFNDPLEMQQLTESWLAYLSSLRLKLLLNLNGETGKFLFDLQFISCEENFEQVVAYNLTPFCDADVPEYKLALQAASKYYDLCHFTAPPSWQINSLALELFFNLNQAQTAFLAEVLDRFDVFAILARLRTANKIAKYKDRYLHRSLLVNDVFLEKDELFLLLEDGEKVKVIDWQMSAKAD